MRLPDWQERLRSVVRDAKDKPFETGFHDWWTFACACYEAVTGEQPPANVGPYRSCRAAFREVRKAGGSDLIAAVTAVAGQPLPGPLYAGEGDWLVHEDENGQHIGIHIGIGVAVLLEHGLSTVPAKTCSAAWRIG